MLETIPHQTHSMAVVHYKTPSSVEILSSFQMSSSQLIDSAVLLVVLKQLFCFSKHKLSHPVLGLGGIALGSPALCGF